MGCIFCKIADKKIPAKLVYEDDKVVAFDDINPQAPTHTLIIPREHIATVNDLAPKHNELVGHMFQVAREIAKQKGIDASGYRSVFNCNRDSGQEVFHIHLHVLGGRRMSWPPG